VEDLPLGLDEDGVLELLGAMYEPGELAARDVDLEEIDVVELGDVVEPPRLEPRAIDDMGIGLEEAEHVEGSRTGHEQTRPAGIGTEIERVLPAVAHCV